jgi:RNA-directed DNA polymerase
MAGNENLEEWRKRVRTNGKEAVILEEMLRLGFWPPDDARAVEHDAAVAALVAEGQQINTLQIALSAVEAKINLEGNVGEILKEIRRRRIERVRLEREERRQQKAAAQEAHRAADRQRRRTELPFLGRGVSGGLRYEGGDPDRLTTRNLPLLQTAADLSGAIGLEPGELAWLTYHRGASAVDHYHRFTIPKRSGGRRVISSPKKRLRLAQAWVLENILSRIELHPAAMAFRSGLSIRDNAVRHQGRALVIRLDLKDFFPSVKLARVKGLFRSFGYNEGIATLLALLSTEAPRVPVTLDGQTRFVATGQRQIPQGACTSPALTNILGRSLDARLEGLARRFGFSYTRYADDLVFSHHSKEVPLGFFLKAVRQVVAGEGFVVNEEKTHIMRSHQRQVITGLVVNTLYESPRISRTDLRKFRAFLDHCEKQGFKAVSEQTGLNARGYAQGYLAFIQMVSPGKAARLRAGHAWLNQ